MTFCLACVLLIYCVMYFHLDKMINQERQPFLIYMDPTFL